MAGCALGLALFPLGGRLMVATLFQTSAYDPLSLLAVPALLLMVALAASYIPALRAMRVDPITTLHSD